MSGRRSSPVGPRRGVRRRPRQAALLEGAGAAVDIANNGREVLEKLRARPGACDLVLMDVRLPFVEAAIGRTNYRGYVLSYATDILPSMILLGLGAGIGFNPVFLAATMDVGPAEAGLASGIVNTSFMMGGALGLAILASVASSRTGAVETAESLTRGYHAAFLGAALFAALAAALAAFLFRTGAPAMAHEGHGEMRPATAESD